jgi:hypothetical protein
MAWGFSSRPAKEYGADYVLVGALTLFGNGPADCKTLYYKFLEKFYPELAPRYKNLYGTSFEPGRVYQRELDQKSRRLCEKYGIRYRIVP